jgi:hypothetical protein
LKFCGPGAIEKVRHRPWRSFEGRSVAEKSRENILHRVAWAAVFWAFGWQQVLDSECDEKSRRAPFPNDAPATPRLGRAAGGCGRGGGGDAAERATRAGPGTARSRIASRPQTRRPFDAGKSLFRPPPRPTGGTSGPALPWQADNAVNNVIFEERPRKVTKRAFFVRFRRVQSS